jgi:hypothetical protein
MITQLIIYNFYLCRSLECQGGELHLQPDLEVAAIIADGKLIAFGVQQVESALDVFQADAAIVKDVIGFEGRAAVGNKKIQLPPFLPQVYLYPIGLLGMPGYMLEGIFDKGHQQEGSDRYGIGLFPPDIHR